MLTEVYPLLSIIVPVYGTEKFLRKCLDSLLNEVYPNIEIIIVDDDSPDHSAEIIEEYVQKHENIYCVKNEQNQGLFQARLRGYEAAHGEYICTVDSDDYVGIDYHRQMMLKALETNADIVFSDVTIYMAERGTYRHRTYGTYALEGVDLKGPEILSDFFRTEGETSHRWISCTKLYKKELWDRCYPDLMMLNRHQIMLEDAIYGTVFMSRAKRYVACDVDTYFYVKHPKASSGASQEPEKLFGNLEDQIIAFEFLENYLIKENRLEEVQKGFTLLRQKQARVWANIVSGALLNYEAQQQAEALLERIGPGYKNTQAVDDSFFYRQHTPWDNRYEELKKIIADPNTQCVSFDIFDTLIIRPFLNPSDLFSLLNSKMDSLIGTISLRTFAELRVEAERLARKRAKQEHRYEEITLEEIYQELVFQYNIPNNIVGILMQEERELELRFCTARKKLKEIYELAVFLGKKVICISDMYLDREILLAILEKNGYTQIDALFISSEERLTKASGHLYEEVITKLEFPPENILHIGDNWNSDIMSARTKKLTTFFVPRAGALFGNHIPDMGRKKSRASFEAAFQRLPTGNIVKYNYETGYLGIRCMLGMVGNKIFDHPFWSYEPGTDFNRSPYYVGYYALGMHEFGIVQWLLKLCKDKGYQKIHFVARDGYIAMKVYEIVSKYYPDAPPYDYFYMSRKSFLPLIVARPEDLNDLPKFTTFRGKTPQEFIDFLQPILDWNDSNERTYWEKGVILDRPMETEEDYQRFISVLLELSYSQEKNDRYRARMKEHFSLIIGKNDVMFDIGYSGRAQAILSSLLGYGVNAAYIHYLDDQVYTYSERFHFQVNCYYPYTPTVIGKIREILQSETIGSCIGYNLDGPTVTPIFEESIHSFHARFVIGQVHQGACDFAKEFMEIFSDYLPWMNLRDYELSFAHEYFIHYPTRGDIQMFSVVLFEDDVLKGKSYVQRVSDIWWRDLRWYRLKGDGSRSGRMIDSEVDLNSAPIWKYMIYQAMFDRRSLKEQVKLRLQGHPVIFNISRFWYKCLRKIYRGIKGFRSLKYLQHKKPLSPVSQNCPVVEKKLETGKILYSATSEFGILCCMLHKMTYHSNDKCILMVSEWRKNRISTLEKSGIFSEVCMFNDLAMSKVSKLMNEPLIGASEGIYTQYAEKFLAAYENNFPFNVQSFDKIVIHNTAMPIGAYLESRNVQYEAIEDGAGLFSNPELLQSSIKETYPLVEQWLIAHYNTLGITANCNRWYINYSAQSKPFDQSKTEDFNPTAILEHLSDVDLEAILRTFGVTPLTPIKCETGACLLLTYPMSRRMGISESEQKLIYATLIDLLTSDGQPVYLKPHPDDLIDYTDFIAVHKIPAGVLSELLKYAVRGSFSCGISAVSTALNGMTDIPNKIYFDEGLIAHRDELFRYFAANVLLEQVCNPRIVFVQAGACDTLVKNLLGDRNWTNTLSASFSEDVVYFLGNDTEETTMQQVITQSGESDVIISFHPFDGGLPIKISKRKKTGTYMTDLEDEFLYVKGLRPVALQFKREMKMLNIDLIIETYP